MKKGCPACGREFRKGSIVVLFDAHGKRKGARVCQPCADGGMTVVAVRVAPKVTKAPAKDEKDVWLVGVIRQLQTYGKLSEVSSKVSEEAAEREFFRGRAEGLEVAIVLLKRKP